jgi:hypothetical protein
MPNIKLLQKDVPFWLDGKGELTVDIGKIDPAKKIPEDTTSLMNVNFGVQGAEKFKFGNAGSASLSVKGGVHETLVPVWASTSALNKQVLAVLGNEEFLTANPDKMLLVLDIGASGALSSAGTFNYSFLKASTTFEAGAEGALLYARALDKEIPAATAVTKFLGGIQLPSGISRPPEDGEVAIFSYSGYLQLGAAVSAGYELKGTKSFKLGELALSEKYGLSILGKIGVSGSVAGSYSIEVRAAKDAASKVIPGWARVIVKRKKSSEFKIAGDVKVSATGDLSGLPKDADEFLGAALGVNAKNWINMLHRVRELSDLNKIKDELDGLAKTFLSEWVGKGFDELPSEFATVMNRINAVVTSYGQVEDRAVTLFDRYFSKLQALTSHLDTLKKLTDWNALKGNVNPELWDVVRQLTDGEALELLDDKAHKEIKTVIALAKNSFGIDSLFSRLADVDTEEELRALANQKAGDFVGRLLGKTIDTMSTKEVKTAVATLQKVLAREKDFAARFYSQLQKAASHSFGFQLHAEYSRATEREALIDIVINMESEKGRALMRDAGQADFRAVLVAMDPGVVKLNRGVLTHKVTKQSSFSINIIGWHNKWNYAGFDKVITSTEQQMVPETNGSLTVYTQFDLTVEHLRKKNANQVHSSFMFRALGQTHDAVLKDDATLEYMVDTLSEMSAKYDLTFTDEKTSAGELKDYLAFAKTLGLDAVGATFEELSPMMPKRGQDDFGRVEGSYEVRYSREALQNLLKGTFQIHVMRNTMRAMVLANYIGTPHHNDVGWAFASPSAFALWKQEGPNFSNHFGLEFNDLASPIDGVKPPQRATLDRTKLILLDTLFQVQEALLKAIEDLHGLINSPAKTQLSPAEFEKKLSSFGSALNLFDRFDQVDGRPAGVNTMFAVFDRLVQLSPVAAQTRTASMELKSRVNDDEKKKMFVLRP